MRQPTGAVGHLVIGVLIIGALSIVLAIGLVSRASKRPTGLGLHGSRLTPCPPTPNCVSSDAPDSTHAVAPFRVDVPPAQAWLAARDAVLELPRTRIVGESSDYLHAESRSAVFRFIDDLELHLRPSEGIIAVRSASRLGRSDLGVNRRRVETLRASLVERGVVRRGAGGGASEGKQ